MNYLTTDNHHMDGLLHLFMTHRNYPTQDPMDGNCTIWKSRTGQLDPQSCFRGTFRSRISLDSLGQCIPCTPGHYCDWNSWEEGLTSPKPCPATTYQNRLGADAKSDCKPCSLSLVLLFQFLECRHQMPQRQLMPDSWHCRPSSLPSGPIFSY